MTLNNPALEAETLMQRYNEGLIGSKHPLLSCIQDAVLKLDAFDRLCEYEEQLCYEIGEDGFYIDNSDKLDALESDIQRAIQNRQNAFEALVTAIKNQ